MPYRVMIYGGIAGGIVFLLGSAVMFFIFRIPDTVGELTGWKARREIRSMHDRERAERGTEQL